MRNSATCEQKLVMSPQIHKLEVLQLYVKFRQKWCMPASSLLSVLRLLPYKDGLHIHYENQFILLGIMLKDICALS